MRFDLNGNEHFELYRDGTEIYNVDALTTDNIKDGSTKRAFTDEEKNKLAGIAAGAEVNVQSDWSQTNTGSDDYIKNKPTKLSQFTNDVVNNATLTIQKNGTNVATFTSNDASNKTANITVPTTFDELSAGTTNKPFTATEKTKLSGIAEGAEVNVQSDWSQTTTSADDYIKNKPTKLSQFTNDVVNNATLTIQKNSSTITTFTSNDASSKTANIIVPVTFDDLSDGTTNKAFTSTEKTKLSGIASGAEVNVQSDWSQTNTGSDDYIKNKPTKLSQFTNDVVNNATLTIQKNGTNVATFGANSSTAETANIIVPTTFDDLSDGTTNKAFTSTEKTKLSGIASGAEVNVQSDWSQTTTTADDYIKNKPTKLSQFTNDVVNNATLTIQKNGTNVATFGANSSTAATANITVPTTLDDLSDGTTRKWSNKANVATTLAGYGITDAYTTAQIDSKLSSVYKAAGSAASVSALGTLVAAHEGYVYNMSNDFTTTSDFVEGSGKTYPAGTNVAIVLSGSTYKYDVLAGMVDLTDYAKTENVVTEIGTSGNTLTWKKGTVAQTAITVPYASNAGGVAWSNVSSRPTKLSDFTNDVVNNATLTIQKNSSTITTFTSNASGNATANITVPTTFDDLSDGTTNKAFTSTEKTKLSGIASGAEVNVQSDWNQTTTSADDYIKNKPTKLSQFTNDVVNNATLTIQKNGTNVATFTSNASGNATANITVPTSLDDMPDGTTRKLANYLPLAGGVMTGAVKRSYSTASDDPVINVSSLNQDIWLWRVSDGSYPYYTSAGFGFGLKYLGTGSGNENNLALFADNQSGTQVKAVEMKQDGTIDFKTAITKGGNTILHAGNYNSYSPSLTGTGASGTWGINITGNASTATSATTATNLAGNPSIQAGTSDTSKVTITAGNKTSNEFTIPYATRSRYIEGDNNAASPDGALLRSGAGRADASPAGDTWIFYDTLGGATNPWGIRHNQGDNSIAFMGSGTENSRISLTTGNSYVSGNFGIGTTSPSYKLQVSGDTYSSTSITAGTTMSAGTSITAGTSIRASGNDMYLGSASGSQCHIQYDNTDKCIKFIFD